MTRKLKHENKFEFSNNKVQESVQTGLLGSILSLELLYAKRLNAFVHATQATQPWQGAS